MGLYRAQQLGYHGLHPPEQNVATSGDDMGMPLDPGRKRPSCFAEQNRNSIALIAIHGGSGNKSLVYDFLETQLQAVFGGGESSTLVNSDIQIGAVEVKTAAMTRAVVARAAGFPVPQMRWRSAGSLAASP